MIIYIHGQCHQPLSFQSGNNFTARETTGMGNCGISLNFYASGISAWCYSQIKKSNSTCVRKQWVNLGENECLSPVWVLYRQHVSSRYEQRLKTYVHFVWSYTSTYFIHFYSSLVVSLSRLSGGEDAVVFQHLILFVGWGGAEVSLLAKRFLHDLQFPKGCYQLPPKQYVLQVTRVSLLPGDIDWFACILTTSTCKAKCSFVKQRMSTGAAGAPRAEFLSIWGLCPMHHVQSMLWLRCKRMHGHNSPPLCVYRYT